MFNKILYIMWNEKFSNPLRVLNVSCTRYREGGFSSFRKGVNREYFTLVSCVSNPRKKEAVYKQWIRENEKKSSLKQSFVSEPLISIVTPVYNTDMLYLEKMIESVIAQDYINWELCIADDASSNPETLRLLKKYVSLIPQIKVVYRQQNGHIAEASNSALEIANGEYVAFLDHDDRLAPDALSSMVRSMNENPKWKFIYSDEDKIDENGVRYDPHFKSGWNPDMFYSQNYIAHLTVIKKSLVDKVGGFRKGYEGSQDYDLYLRVLGNLEENEIGHIPKVLYHWRALKNSTACSPGAKPYTTEAGIRALQDFFESRSKKVSVQQGAYPNTYRVTHRLPQNPPMVSLLIPTRDRYDLLSKCIQSILEKTVYPNYEIIIIDNNSRDSQTLEYLELLNTHEKVTVITYAQPFNYSAINNFAVSQSKGEIIGLINNDVEIISQEWLTEMVQHAVRPEIGAVGAKLYYGDGTIQHAGVILGIGGVAGHSHKYFPRNASGYFSRLQLVQNLSAVTAACLVIRKELYEKVGGLDEKNLTVAFNDVDFCLKLLKKGYRNLWTPYVELYHHESKSRGYEDTPEKKERFRREIRFMKEKWGNLLKRDNYYNQNLTLNHENFDINVNNGER